MRLNVHQVTVRTYEGAPAVVTDAANQLRRAVMSCMLWEDQFYENGVSIAERISTLIKQVDATECMDIAIEARQRFKLRHVPLLIAREMARLPEHRVLVAHTLEQIIDRPDEITEFLAIYWKDKKQPLAAQVKKGLAAAFRKFDEYRFAKYNRDGPVKLRDALFLVHAKPTDAAQRRYTKLERKEGKRVCLNPGEQLFRKIVDNTLTVPDTWEVALSGGADKRETFERLMAEKKLGALAFLRNLRNMQQTGVDETLVRAYSEQVNVDRVLPFRFVAAAKYVPMWEPIIEPMLLRAAQSLEKMEGPTAVLVDHSGSMQAVVSQKSEITRFDAAAALAMVVRETCERMRVFTFSDRCIEVPPRRGFAMRDAIRSVINPTGTLLGSAVRYVYSAFPECRRLIVITDEQSANRPPAPQGTGYIINVGGYQNGIGYGPWLTINGWSEAILDYIREYEA